MAREAPSYSQHVSSQGEDGDWRKYMAALEVEAGNNDRGYREGAAKPQQICTWLINEKH